MSDEIDPNQINDKPAIHNAVWFAFIVLIIFVGVFTAWTLFSTLESAAIAPGRITVDTNRKTIQHLEGGIIEAIYVREGDTVNKDDLLIKLSETRAIASLNLLQGQMDAFQAQEARLLAERDRLQTVIFPMRLIERREDPKVGEIIHGQTTIFNARRKSFEDRLAILNQRITQLQKEIDSLNAQVTSETRQLELIDEEIEAVAYLEKKKLIEKPRLLALQREAARLIGNRGEDLGLIAKAEQRIGETQTQKIGIENQMREEVVQELREVQQKIYDITEQLKNARDIAERIEIRAPRDGRVVNLQYHTIGGVITPGTPIMDIVPSQDELVVEARVNPLDIDVVHPKLVARVQLSAYKQRHMPQINGEVIYVSADSLIDEVTHETYYLARILIQAEDLAEIADTVALYPGMPVQVMIITENRSPLDYFITPITDSFDRAFRED